MSSCYIRLLSAEVWPLYSMICICSQSVTSWSSRSSSSSSPSPDPEPEPEPEPLKGVAGVVVATVTGDLGVVVGLGVVTA